MRTNTKGFPKRRNIYTLAQKRTANNSKKPEIVKGNGTELKDTKALKGRAKRKMITQKRTLKLIDVAHNKGDFERARQYWNTFHCQDRLTTTGGKQYGNYCKNRLCVLCCSIRKAIIINKYGPVIDAWKEPYLVGLTVKAMPAYKLNEIIDRMYKAFNRITEKYHKREKRGTGFRLIGIKTLECNFNEQKRTYNPHFHIIVPNKKIGEALVNEWCKLWGSQYAYKKAQYCQPVKSREKALIEIIKYGTKIFSEPDLDKRLHQKASAKIYAAALYNILNAMNKHRIFERFGFNLPKAVKPKGGISTKVTIYIKWKYDGAYFDWVGEDTDGMLTLYTPSPDLLDILNNHIDILLE